MDTGPSFEELAARLTPEQKHRYTQQRQMRQEMYNSFKRGKASRDEVESQFNKSRTMFEKPGSEDGPLFDLLYQAETDTEVEDPTPLGKEYGGGYASKEAAAARKEPKSAKSYNDLNSRPVGFSERTFLPPEGNLASAAKRRLEKTRGKRR